MMSSLETVASILSLKPNVAQNIIHTIQFFVPIYYQAGITCVLFSCMFETLHPLSVYGRLYSNETLIKIKTKNVLFTLVSQTFHKGTAFLFFYTIGIIVNLVTIYLSILGSYPHWSTGLLIAYQLHLTRRFYECLFVHKFSLSAKMPLLLILAGTGHYIFTSFAFLPVSLHLEPRFYEYKGWIDPEEEHDVTNLTLGGEIDQLSVFIGIILFLFGNIMQYIAHLKLASLRVNKDPEEKELYPLPTQSLFKFSLTPHYTAEIAIYLGLSIARLGLECQSGFRFDSGNVPFFLRFNGLLLTLWVVTNLSTTALRTKQWYLRKAKSKEDKEKVQSIAAILPFIL
jgi:hypothetical protein